MKIKTWVDEIELKCPDCGSVEAFNVEVKCEVRIPGNTIVKANMDFSGDEDVTCVACGCLRSMSMMERPHKYVKNSSGRDEKVYLDAWEVES
jgi:hypothetical protein